MHSFLAWFSHLHFVLYKNLPTFFTSLNSINWTLVQLFIFLCGLFFIYVCLFIVQKIFQPSLCLFTFLQYICTSFSSLHGASSFFCICPYNRRCPNFLCKVCCPLSHIHVTTMYVEFSSLLFLYVQCIAKDLFSSFSRNLFITTPSCNKLAYSS